MRREWLIAAALLGCMERTEIRPAHKEPPPAQVYVGDRSCMVHDYEYATDLPQGAKNLGWVVTPQVVVEGKESDEATYVEARKKICEMGGDALSQAAWIKDMDDPRPKLKVNAWSLP